MKNKNVIIIGLIVVGIAVFAAFHFFTAKSLEDQARDEMKKNGEVAREEMKKNSEAARDMMKRAADNQ